MFWKLDSADHVWGPRDIFCPLFPFLPEDENRIQLPKCNFIT
jgi:hypothetical protein